jgi:hypothetical protein
MKLEIFGARFQNRLGVVVVTLTVTALVSYRLPKHRSFITERLNNTHYANMRDMNHKYSNNVTT